ncbi:NhaP-type Na+/H+ and K+/H+ antiporter [Planomicrobium stackebrandtii]|uniref:NhaP-type Na+/H+ and K+/H+ antiporter n=1 Tax=Planomicrobium stackebrandtii TaxID=253160 RepID=A0ABU0GQR7_9BACL|nr:hypothetical protein [Planomicrobium stackebrandtii]MDQ0427695.1 NhaP-type Na+/H+ and K+/H+ antiporter [Planomicrobium stackebrandtii]
MKVYYYRLSMLSFIIFIEAFCIIMLFSGIENEVIDFNYVVAVFILSLLIALVSFLLVGKIIKVVQNFRIKSHYKFQIVLPEVDSDNLYIIRMYNKDICICSKDPNSEINEESEKTYLIPLEDIMKKELTKTTWPLPEMNLLQKIFN